jgi:hypothetical protein
MMLLLLMMMMMMLKLYLGPQTSSKQKLEWHPCLQHINNETPNP